MVSSYHSPPPPPVRTKHIVVNGHSWLKLLLKSGLKTLPNEFCFYSAWWCKFKVDSKYMESNLSCLLWLFFSVMYCVKASGRGLQIVFLSVCHITLLYCFINTTAYWSDIASVIDWVIMVIWDFGFHALLLVIVCYMQNVYHCIIFYGIGNIKYMYKI